MAGDACPRGAGPKHSGLEPRQALLEAFKVLRLLVTCWLVGLGVFFD